MQKQILILIGTLFLGACIAPPTTSSAPPLGQMVRVEAVIDGDTIDVLLNGRSTRVRYIGIDTPERSDPFYAEATEANHQQVAGQEVILVQDVSETDRYGRLLRYIYLPDGTFVNGVEILSGVANAGNQFWAAPLIPNVAASFR